ncbi:MAG TPA: histidine kinase [Puia sp.]|nr:histidine kinase [Puia sp.]
MKLLIPLLLLACQSYSARAQEYSYTHYDISDGLAGSTAYCIAQDKEGFIWIGTETGLSRFDGTHFSSYTTTDGLPDMEVLQMHCDSKDRLWMALFHPSVCYCYKGKIHNASNDSLLKKIHCSSYIEGIAEDKEGNILLKEPYALHLVTTEGQVIDYHDIDGKPVSRFYAIGGSKDSSYFVVLAGQDVYKLQDGNFTKLFHVSSNKDISIMFLGLNPSLFICETYSYHIIVMRTATGQVLKDTLDYTAPNFQSVELVGDSLIYTNRAVGVDELNIKTGAWRRYMPGMQVSRTFRDDEGNLWFSTMGQGIYRLNSNEIKNMTLLDRQSQHCAALYIKKADHDLYIGATREMAFTYNPQKSLKGFKVGFGTYGYITYVDKAPNGALVYGSHDHVGLADRTVYRYLAIMQGKVIVREDADKMIVGNSRGVFRIDIPRLTIVDTIWRHRCSALLLQNDTLYIGALNGLYVKNGAKDVSFLGDSIPFLKKRISAIAKDGNALWVGSYDAGAVRLIPGQPPMYLTTLQGLSSNICRTLTVHGNDLWVGTDKGLNRVSFASGEMTITLYTAKDGLASDMINAVYVDGDTIYVGTPEGFSYFNPMRTNLSAGCRLVLLRIANSGRDKLPDTAHLVLKHTENNIRFDFVAISYKSAGNITYHYRLSGLDSNWKTTKETFLDYPTLPSGDYALQLYAVNKFGVKSQIRTIPFTVETPFWKATWFELIILASFLSLTWLFVSLRIKHIRRQQEEEELLNKRMTEMEHTALQAQMNPHFIFNCLNSIQQYIFDQDILAANKYITGFAKLIRATLHNSTRDLIPLEDELEYLSTYLSLEKLRFKEKMSYAIEVASDLSIRRGYCVPPMIIQPYVENCMRHGLRHRRIAGGYIRIKIHGENNKLVVVVEDNGIGREKAASYKTREHIEYQSKGMSLTADRIRLINSIHEESIEVEIIDLKDPQGAAAGTRVVIKFPKFDLTYQEDTI